MDAFPAFFPLAGAKVVIAGSGEPAAQRARLLEGSPAEIVRLEGGAALDPAAYAGASLVFVASHDDEFARAAAAAAAECGAPVNVFDRPALSDFSTPAIVDRGSVVAAVGTAGAAPLLAQMLRAEIESRIPADAGERARRLGLRRQEIKAAFPDLAERRAFLRRFLEGPPLDDAALDSLITHTRRPPGGIVLIETPAADDLLSLRAARALAAAEAVVAPAEARALVDRHARRDAERLSPDGDAAGLAARLAARASAGDVVAVVGAPAALLAALDGADASVERLKPAPAA